MASEVVIQKWCDIHLRRDDKRVAASFSEVVSIGSTRKLLDLCGECAEMHVQSFMDVLLTYGQVPLDQPTATLKTQYACLVPNCVRVDKPYLSASGLRSHMLSQHGIASIRQARQRLSSTA